MIFIELIFWGFIKLTTIFLINNKLRKWVIFIVGILLTVGTFLILAKPENSFSFDDDLFTMMICNCICIGGGCWVFRLGPTPTL
jgi:hypothetical protein